MRLALLTLLFSCTCMSAAYGQLPRLAANDNRTPAGRLANGVLELDLEIRAGMWHPDGEDDPGVDVIALGVAGKQATVPAPLIRVPLGTVVLARVRNTLAESMMVFGLNRTHAFADSVRIPAGGSQEFTITADQPGTYIYGAWRKFRAANPLDTHAGNDMTTGGAFIVDAPGPRPADRVFVMNMIDDTARVIERHGRTSIVATINGKAWPHTERLTHDVGDTVIWRVLNASIIPHPMHLHGFYFDVLARGTPTGDTIYEPAAFRKVVTERMLPITSMTMRWVPERAGNWLFHCHLTAHTQMRGDFVGSPRKASGKHVHDAMHGMSNLMLGAVVRGKVARDPTARVRRQLVVSTLDSVPGEYAPRYNYALDGAANPALHGPTIVLRKGEPAAITVVNRMREATAVHWHGIELESYSDGVAGFGGHGRRISPLIVPGDSFVARMTPPRAGTFIYHTHVDELRQQRGGLYGALLIVDDAYDAQTDRVILLGSAPDSALGIRFNGERHPDLAIEAGKTYRLRVIHIMTGRPNMSVALVDAAGKMAEWRLVAKDGADLPAHQAKAWPARLPVSNGETYDVLFTAPAPGTWRLEARAGNNAVFGHMTITAR